MLNRAKRAPNTACLLCTSACDSCRLLLNNSFRCPAHTLRARQLNAQAKERQHLEPEQNSRRAEPPYVSTWRMTLHLVLHVEPMRPLPHVALARTCLGMHTVRPRAQRQRALLECVALRRGGGLGRRQQIHGQQRPTRVVRRPLAKQLHILIVERLDSERLGVHEQPAAVDMPFGRSGNAPALLRRPACLFVSSTSPSERPARGSQAGVCPWRLASTQLQLLHSCSAIRPLGCE